MHASRAFLILSAATAAATCHAGNAFLYPVTAQAETDTGTTWGTTTSSQYLTAHRSSNNPIEGRGLLEFDLSAIPANWPVYFANLSYGLALTSGNSSNVPQLQFHGYAGNGTPEPADATRPSNPVATAPAQLSTGPQNVYLDLPYVQSLINSNAPSRWLGLYTYQLTPGTQAGIWSTNNTPQLNWPKLNITYSTPDVWVTGSDLSARRYSTFTGALVETLPVPYDGTRPASDTAVRGTAVDRDGRLVVFNGAAAAQVSTYDPAAAAWTHRQAPKLNALPSPSPSGSVATVGSYQFAADVRQNTANPENGIVRLNAAAPETVHFQNTAPTLTGNTQAVTRGHDGLLYALTNFPANTVKVYNPYSLAPLRTVTLPLPSATSLVVGPTGEMYASSNGSVYAFAPDGTLLRSLAVPGAAGLDLAVDGSLIVGSSVSGIHLTSTALTTYNQVVPNGGFSQQFVSFAVPAPQRGWRPVPGSMSGTFSDPANWTGPVPNSALGDADSIAVFSATPPAPTSAAFTVVIDAPVTLGTLAIDSPHAHVLSGTSPITLAVPAGQRAFIDVVQGDHTLRTPVTLASDLTVHAAPGASLFISSPTVGTGPSAKFDLASHNLIWDYAPTDSAPTLNLRRALLTGRSSGQVDPQTGLFSSTAKADPTGNLAIGYAEASALGLSTFQGQPVDASAILFLLTTNGDTDLNGTVDADDYARLDRGLALRLNNWLNGDFDYNGIINASDYLLIDTAYLHQQGTPPSPTFLSQRQSQFGATYVSQLLTNVPEPSALAYLYVILALLSPRRRTPDATAKRP
jgi:hypothetical protein